ncbi:hypothetical protein ACIPYS_20980 [Kitasatospora sp. NPDC089913]|uniref:hypothetical protein n=1 Tax=Kitasatospora sp. NPDC089913 TaxID=3364080 RepID=UPI00380D43CE
MLSIRKAAATAATLALCGASALIAATPAQAETTISCDRLELLGRFPDGSIVEITGRGNCEPGVPASLMPVNLKDRRTGARFSCSSATSELGVVVGTQCRRIEG